MARARNIKPGFFTNGELIECQPLARLLFAGLWCEADRRGILEDRPKTLKIKILPGDDCDVDALLDELAARGFIRRYTADGIRCIVIANFEKHQNPHVNERPSTLPASEQHQTSTVQAPERYQSNRADSLLPLTDSGIPSNDAGASKPSKDRPPRKPTPTEDEGDEPAKTAPWSMLEALCDELGQDATALSKPSKDRQLAAAKRLAASGLDENGVRAMVRWLAPQPWVGGAVDFALLEKQLGKWELAGKPDAPPPRNGPTPIRPAPKESLADAAKRIAALEADIRHMEKTNAPDWKVRNVRRLLDAARAAVEVA